MIPAIRGTELGYNCTHYVCTQCNGIRATPGIAGTDLVNAVCSSNCLSATRPQCECKCGGEYHAQGGAGAARILAEFGQLSGRPQRSRTRQIKPIKPTNLARFSTLCQDGTYSVTVGPGACAWHGGVKDVGVPLPGCPPTAARKATPTPPPPARAARKLAPKNALPPAPKPPAPPAPPPVQSYEPSQVYKIPLEQISFDRQLFQNREADYSEESVQRILQAIEAGTFRFEVFDPILLWQRPDGRLIVLSGHSRTEAFNRAARMGRREFATIPAKIIQVSQDEARRIALESNVLATRETDVERAAYYRTMREQGTGKEEIEQRATKPGAAARQELNLFAVAGIGAIVDKRPPGLVLCRSGKFSTTIGPGHCSHHGGAMRYERPKRERRAPMMKAKTTAPSAPPTAVPQTTLAPPTPAGPLTNLMEDIPYRVGYDAHRGTSFSPERRAVQEQEGYAHYLTETYNRLAKDRTAAQLQELNAEFARFRQGYKKRYLDYLRSRSGLVSFMIVGPAKFPVRQMEKKNRAIGNKLQELETYAEKALNAIQSNFDIYPEKRLNAPIQSGEADTVQRLLDKLQELERTQEMMKEGNKIIRSGDDVRNRLLALGWKEKVINEVLATGNWWGVGFPKFMLTNNAAEIRRLKERLKGEEIRANVLEKTDASQLVFEGGYIEPHEQDNRLRIFFDDIPDAEIRQKLKGMGFRWSPSNKAWQRQLTVNALLAAKRAVGIAGLAI